MNSFFKALSALFFTLALLMAAVFKTQVLYADPSPGGQASFGSVSSQMSSARVTSDFPSNKPYPTNKWFTSLFTNPKDTSTGDDDIPSRIGNRVSPTPMSMIYDSSFPWYSGGDGTGYSLGGHVLGFNGQNEIYAGNGLAIAVQAATSSGIMDINDDTVIKADNIKLKNYSDWSVTTVLEDRTNSANKMTTTFGKGFVFSYNYFTPGVNPRIKTKFTRHDYASGTQIEVGNVHYFYDDNGTMKELTGNTTYNNITDHIMLRVQIKFEPGTSFVPSSSTYQYFGIYAPPGTSFSINIYEWGWWHFQHVLNVALSGATESDRYLAIALLKSPSAAQDDDGAFTLFKEYYKYAYNFISTTSVSWTYNNDATLTTTFNFNIDAKRTDHSGYAAGQTIFALYPHQWANLVSAPSAEKNAYNSIRGKLKAYAGSSFQTKHNFNGIVPFLSYEVPQGTEAARMQTYINYDKNIDISQTRWQDWAGNTYYKGLSNAYYHGKAIARAANLIPVFHQKGDFAARDSVISKLKTELEDWYQAGGTKYFGYDNVWRGILASNPGGYDDFGAKKYNDHHFHYGYFVYASAILAMFDPSFITQYGGIVNLIIKDFFNPDRNDTNFPFLRHFDVYEGHSYANGRGGDSWWGNDEESSSEAMNAWAGIYLWGLVSGNDAFKNLAIYGYTTQYEAIKYYYFNMYSSDPDKRIWEKSPSGYNHISATMLYDNTFRWSTHWQSSDAQSIMGIQVLPLTPSMLYLGYNTAYASDFYNEYNAGRFGNARSSDAWRDIWLRFKALFDGPGALSDFNAFDPNGDNKGFPDTYATDPGYAGDDGSSMSFSYHFIHFFNSLGQVDTGYYADTPSFLVMNKNGTRTFIAYNPDKTSSKTVTFKARSGGSAGTMTVPPGALAKTSNFTDFEYEYNAAVVPSDGISVQIADSSGTPKSSLIWDASVFKTSNSISQHYLDISVNYNYSNWKAVIYTDNKSSVSVANLPFSGNISSDTISGFVASHNASDTMIPIFWRAVSTDSYTQDYLFDASDYSWSCWNPMRDVSSFTAPDLHIGSEEIRFIDARGFKHNRISETAYNYLELKPDWKMRIYFMADFSKAVKTQYKANIIVHTILDE